MPLTPRQLDILAFERTWHEHRGNREADIVDRFEVSPVRYRLELNALLDDPEALAADPRTVRRLLEQRGVRQRSRSGRRA